jgi:radical SAM protein with 4Fe4S-binding SPASM domain
LFIVKVDRLGDFVEPLQVVPYSGLRSQTRIDLASSLPLAAPFSINIETSNRCNFNCRMCPVSFDDYEEVVGGITRLSTEAIDRLYADLVQMGQLKTIRFYGEGEPLLDKELPRSIRVAHEMGVVERSEVTCNGSALTEPVGRALIESGLTYLRISIYGLTEERQRYITQSKVSAERIYQNVKAFRELRDSLGSKKPFLYVKIIDSGDPEDRRLLTERYGPIADETAVEPAIDWNSYDGRDLLQFATPGSLAPRSRKRVCPYPFYSLVVKANGDVVACCADWNKATAVGSIHDESFTTIWNGDRLRDFRRMHLEGRRHENPSCASCWLPETLPDDLDGIPPEQFDRVLG